MQIISSVARCDNLAAAGAFSQNFCELPSNTQRLYRSVRPFPPLRQLCRLNVWGCTRRLSKALPEELVDSGTLQGQLG